MVEFDRSAFIGKFQEEAQDLLQRLNEGVITLEARPGQPRAHRPDAARRPHASRAARAWSGSSRSPTSRTGSRTSWSRCATASWRTRPTMSDYVLRGARRHRLPHRERRRERRRRARPRRRSRRGWPRWPATATPAAERAAEPPAAADRPSRARAAKRGRRPPRAGAGGRAAPSRSRAGRRRRATSRRRRRRADAEDDEPAPAPRRSARSATTSSKSQDAGDDPRPHRARSTPCSTSSARSSSRRSRRSSARTDLRALQADDRPRPGRRGRGFKSTLAAVADEEPMTRSATTLERRSTRLLVGDAGASCPQLRQGLRATTSRAPSVVVNDLQEQGMRLRMLPANTIFQAFPRAVRDLAKQFHKDIDLIIEGGDTELDKKVLEEINDPLVHIMRNAVDHGIEDPETRVARGQAARPAPITLGRAAGGRPHRHRDQRRRRRHRPREGARGRGPQGLHHRGRGPQSMSDREATVPHLRVRLLDGRDHHRDLRPRRRHGRRARVRRREAQGLARRASRSRARARRSG